MSHPEQIGFFRAVAQANPDLVKAGRVIEIGSYDVNGGIRKMFGGTSEYVGVDLTEGPSVDVVSFGHEVDLPDDYFDLAISGECFEHDEHWPETIRNMWRMTRPGGLVAFTCASRGRPEHGTSRSDGTLSPGTTSRGLDYYRNLEQADVEAALPLSEAFSSYQFWYLPTNFDLFFAGIRGGEAPAGAAQAHLPSDDDVLQLSRIMSAAHRIARLPLRAGVRILDEEPFQRFAIAYWGALLKMQDRVAGGRFRRAEH